MTPGAERKENPMRMTLKTVAASLAIAAFAPQAFAATVSATVNFTSDASGTSGLTGLYETTFATSATYTNANGVTSAATVTSSAIGLGIRSPGDETREQAEGLEEIDGFPLGTTETLTVSFSDLVFLRNIVFSNVDPDDDFEFAVNGNTIFSPVPAGLFSTTFGDRVFQVLGEVRSFTIRVSGDAATDGSGDDGFGIRSVTIEPSEVSAVPLPAGGLLLLGGLGGLMVLRRRKAA